MKPTPHNTEFYFYWVGRLEANLSILFEEK
jgi:hypothetical protein